MSIRGEVTITVQPQFGGEFRVTVEESGSETTHVVTVHSGRDGVADEALVEASFGFLLDREPKESILPRFDLAVIERYFPDYPSRIGDYL